MDHKLKEIKKYLQEIANNGNYAPITATVTAVSGDTCTVQLAGGLEIDDVKLKSTIGGSDALLLIPKTGTQVSLLSYTGAPDNLTVVKVDEVEKISYKQNGLEVLIDSTDGKVKVANGQVSLKDVLDDLMRLLKQFKVFTPVGPSGTPLPDTITEIQQVETKFNQLLK